MNIQADLLRQKGIYESVGERHPGAKKDKVPVSGAVHMEIAELATHIQRLRERLMAQSQEPDTTSQPVPGGECGEEDAFPTWLN